MRSVTIEMTIEGKTHTAEFLKSEDCGYSAGRLLIDLPNGDVISISKNGSKYLETLICGKIGKNTIEHATKREAVMSAAESYFAAAVEDSFFDDLVKEFA